MINNSLEGFQPQLTTLKFLFLIAFNKVCLYKKSKNAWAERRATSVLDCYSEAMVFLGGTKERLQPFVLITVAKLEQGESRSKACFDYAETQPNFASVTRQSSLLQNWSKLSAEESLLYYAETQPNFAAVTHFRVAAAKLVQARRLYLQYCSSACSSCRRYA